MNDLRHGELRKSLATYGSEISKWPPERAAGAREALMSVPDFRRAWEDERALDRALGGARQALDDEIARSGALQRLRWQTLARLPLNALEGLGWHRVAAAVLIAGMLGGATDLLLPEPVTDTADVVMLDPLSGVDETELQ